MTAREGSVKVRWGEGARSGGEVLHRIASHRFASDNIEKIKSSRVLPPEFFSIWRGKKKERNMITKN